MRDEYACKIKKAVQYFEQPFLSNLPLDQFDRTGSFF